MGLRETLNNVHDCLHNADIEHALIGGLGLASLGIHRATFDIDLLIDGRKKDLVKQAMEQSGWKLEMETSEVLHFSGKGKVDFLLANRPLSLDLLATAHEAGLGIRCVSPEGMIGLKIQAYKNDPNRELQDKADIHSILAKYPKLNWKKVKQYADLFDEWSTIEILRKRS